MDKAQAPPDLAAWFDPLTGWEAASRWNRSTFDWMATSWQQWLALVTTLPPHFPVPTEVADPVTPAKAGAQEARAARPSNALGSRLRGNAVRAVARPEPKRPAPKKKSAAQGRKRG